MHLETEASSKFTLCRKTKKEKKNKRDRENIANNFLAAILLREIFIYSFDTISNRFFLCVAPCTAIYLNTRASSIFTTSEQIFFFQ